MVTKATNYPTILVHGFLGVDQKNYFSYLYQYFGSFTKDLRKHWEEDLGYEVYQPALGPFTGMWERSCELYAYIFGGRVDYGVYHSQKHGIKRFGRTYEGVLKDLGTPGDHAKVNLIGHSFGGPTVTMFSWIMTEGCKEELDATPADEVSDFFKGGKGDMLHTVSTLSATNRGTAATVFAGDKLLHTSKVLMTAGAYAGDMINNVYDLYFDPWGAMEDPATCKSKAFGKDMASKQAGITAYAEAYDGGNIWYEMKPSVSDAMLAGWKANPKTYYIAHPACGTHPTKAGRSSATTPTRMPASTRTGSRTTVSSTRPPWVLPPALRKSSGPRAWASSNPASGTDFPRRTGTTRAGQVCSSPKPPITTRSTPSSSPSTRCRTSNKIS